MATIAGASQYLASSSLANARGIAPSTPSLLGGGSADGLSLLEAGRGLASSGFGLSTGARAQNQSLLSRSGEVNQMFSLGVGTSATVDGARQEILALRAGKADTQLAPSLRGNVVDEEI